VTTIPTQQRPQDSPAEERQAAPPYASVPALPDGANVALSAGAAAATPDCVPCPNCGCGRMEQFCPRCGQENTDPVVPLRYLLRDIVDEVLKVDGRIWATLRALLFRPGQLTRDFLDGRRAAYIGPLKLYMAVSAAYFLIFSLTGVDKELRKGFSVGTQAGIAGATRASSVPMPAAGSAEVAATSSGQATPPGRTAADPKRAAKEKRFARINEGGQWFLENLSLIGLGLLPVYAAGLGLFYFRRRRELPFVAHFVLTLHAQSALYLFFLPLVAFRASDAWMWWNMLMVAVVNPAYSYLALRRAYDDPAGAPRWKTAVKALLWTGGHMVTVLVLSAVALLVYVLLPLSWF